jgi:hypothetical protein
MNLFSLFTVLLLITQTPIPVPRQAPDGPTASRGQANTQGKSHNAPPAPSMAVVQPLTAPEGQDANGEHTKDNAPHSVIVRELPTVSISKDWADRGVWWFSLCLVIVGGAQAFYVAKTLGAINQQSKHMARQNAQMVSKERARLVVEVLNPPGVVLLGWHEFGFRVTNLGPTNAYSIQAFSSVALVTKGSQPSRDFDAIYTPTVIKPEDPSVVLSASSYNIDRETSESLQLGTKIFHLAGVITYEDVFGEKRETCFHERLIVTASTWDENSPDDSSVWVQDGPPSHNVAK